MHNPIAPICTWSLQKNNGEPHLKGTKSIKQIPLGKAFKIRLDLVQSSN